MHAGRSYRLTPNKTSTELCSVFCRQICETLMWKRPHCSLPAAALRFSACAMINNWFQQQKPGCSSSLPCGCWQEQRQQIKPTGGLQSTHTHWEYTGLPWLPLPPSPPLLPPSVLHLLAGRRSIAHRRATFQQLLWVFFPIQWQCRDLRRDGWSWSAFPCYVCASACRGNPSPGEPPRYPAALQPAPAPKTVPSAWTPRPSPKAFLLGSSLCESVLCATKTLLWSDRSMQALHNTDVTHGYVMMHEIPASAFIIYRWIQKCFVLQMQHVFSLAAMIFPTLHHTLNLVSREYSCFCQAPEMSTNNRFLLCAGDLLLLWEISQSINGALKMKWEHWWRKSWQGVVDQSSSTVTQ